MKVKCVRLTSYNGDDYSNYLTLEKVYDVIGTDLISGSFIIRHDKSKGFLPIHLFEILD